MNLSVSQVLNDPFILRTLLLEADYETVIEYCRSHVETQEICRDNIFWIQKARHDFDVTPNEFRNTTLFPIQRYLQLLTENGGVVIGSENFINLNEFVTRAIRQNRPDLVEYTISLGFNRWDIPSFIYASQGNKEMVNKYLAFGKIYNSVAEGALMNNDVDLFNHVRSLAPGGYYLQWGLFLGSAVYSGNQQLISYIQSLIPPNYHFFWNQVLVYLARFGNINPIKYILTLVPLNYDPNWNVIITNAIINGHKQLYNDIIKLVPNYPWNRNIIAKAIASTGNYNWFNEFIKSAPRDYSWDWNELLAGAASGGQFDLFNSILHLASLDPTWMGKFDWNKLLNAAITGGRAMIDYIRSLAPEDFQWDANQLSQVSGSPYELNYIKSFVPDFVF